MVGTDRGVYALKLDGTAWDALGTGLPNAPVFELDYDIARDKLMAGLLGRGAWVLTPARAGRAGRACRRSKCADATARPARAMIGTSARQPGGERMRWSGREGSSNVEDRRGMGLGRGPSLGCGGLLVVGVIALLTGADPRQILQLLSGAAEAPTQQREGPGPRPAGRGAEGRAGPVRVRRAEGHRGDLERDLRASRLHLPEADHGALQPRGALGLRDRLLRRGALLLPGRPQGLPRRHASSPSSTASSARPATSPPPT